MKQHKVIIDTDPGVDDAMAIFAALAQREVDLLGLTTTYGNVSVAQASQNALTLLEMAEVQLPVAQGAYQPLMREPVPFADFVHGVDGFGDQFLSQPLGQIASQSAAEFMVEQVMQQPNEVNLVCIGPLSNLAQALELEPQLPHKVKQVVIMGGTLDHRGNVSPVAEANIFADPHAADKVMAADWPLVMVGLDVTYQVVFDADLFADIAAKNAKVGGFLQRAAEYYIDFYRNEHGVQGCHGHDLMALAYVINPDWFDTVSGPICVATEGVATGQTIMKRVAGASYFLDNWEQRPAQQACMQVEGEAILRLFRNSLMSDFW